LQERGSFAPGSWPKTGRFCRVATLTRNALRKHLGALSTCVGRSLDGKNSSMRVCWVCVWVGAASVVCCSRVVWDSTASDRCFKVNQTSTEDKQHSTAVSQSLSGNGWQAKLAVQHAWLAGKLWSQTGDPQPSGGNMSKLAQPSANGRWMRRLGAATSWMLRLRTSCGMAMVSAKIVT
jgi:hypothetical protein